MSKGIFVLIEHRDGKVLKVGLELLGKAAELSKELSQPVTAVIFGGAVSVHAEMLIRYGADRVVYAEDPMLSEYITEPYAKAMTKVIADFEPEIVLFGATALGRDLAPRVAARVHTGLTADCTALAIDEESKLLRMTRPAFGGNLMATIVCSEHRPQMATVRPGVMTMRTPDETRKGEVIECKVEFTPADMNVELVKTEMLAKRQVDITESRVLVSGGRGVGGSAGFVPLKELAELLGGEVAASRAGVDSGWAEKERQVGQTGKTVRPGVYIACGISGAIQHLAGMEESDCIIAINLDASAPMMDIASLGVAGDLKVIVPKLSDAIRKHRAEQVLR